MPPPPYSLLLPEIVLLVMVRVPKLEMPPPPDAVLSEIVLLVMVPVPWLTIPPAGSVAAGDVGPIAGDSAVGDVQGADVVDAAAATTVV